MSNVRLHTSNASLPRPRMTSIKVSKVERCTFLWIVTLPISAVTVMISGGSLLLGRYPSPQMLPFVYAAYCLGTCLGLHAIFFIANAGRQVKQGRTLSRRVPRYLEYVYALLLSISLTQIYFMNTQFSDFISVTAGDENELLSKMVSAAHTHLTVDCPSGGRYFPATYCAKLQQLTNATDAASYVRDQVLLDREFLTHGVGTQFSRTGSFDVVSPIARLADAYRAHVEFKAAGTLASQSKAFAWLILVLLPVGISLRVLKTSLELFIELS